jgi:hemerythrin
MRNAMYNRTRLPIVLLEIPELDEDHQHLLRRVNALLAAVASRESPVVQSALGELRAEAEAHFAREEILMREAGYPGLKKHCASHQRLLRELSTLRVALDASGRLRVPLAPVSYIRRWFAAHITGEDRMVGAYLDQKKDNFLLGLA